MANLQTNYNSCKHELQQGAGVFLDTLARTHAVYSKPNENMAKRAKAKKTTLKYLWPLLELKSQREAAYRDTFYCNTQIAKTGNGKTYSKFCKKRWCAVCCRIRTSVLINQYKPVLDKLEGKVFVTLTTNLTNNCTNRRRLSATINTYAKHFALIWNRIKKKHGTTIALKKLEVTYNSGNGLTRTGEYFHPHYHVIMPNDKGQADMLVSEWLKDFPDASADAQSIVKADDDSVMELFKYFAKLFDTAKANYGIINLPYPAERMDDIFAVCEGRRIIQTYGGRLLPKLDDDFSDEQANEVLSSEGESSSAEVTSTNASNPDEPVKFYNWNQKAGTWIADDGEMLFDPKDYEYLWDKHGNEIPQKKYIQPIAQA